MYKLYLLKKIITSIPQ